MEEADEDRLFLSSLGITTANQEDIERKKLYEVRTDAGRERDGEEGSENRSLDGGEETDPPSTSQINLFNKSVEVEIDAVASTIENCKAIAENADENLGTVEIEEDEDVRNEDSVGFSLQQALAKDSLKSLKKTRSQLEEAISNSNKHAPINDVGHEVLLDKLVKENPKHKQKQKVV